MGALSGALIATPFIVMNQLGRIIKLLEQIARRN